MAANTPFIILQAEAPDVTFGWAAVWLVVAGVLLAVFLAAYVWVLAQRRRDWLLAAYRRLDTWLDARFPRPWRILKRRFDPQHWYGLALTAMAVILIGSIYVLAGVTESWQEQEELYRIDVAVQRTLEGAASDEAIEALRVITYLGDGITAIVVTSVLAIYLLYRKLRWYVAALLLTMGAGEAVVWTMKYFFARDRPEAGLTDATGHSFPSGHTFTATALYGFLIFLLWRLSGRLWIRAAGTALLGTIILLVGLSRIFLSVHWTSDVLGGIIIGLAWLVFSLVAAKALETWNRGRTASTMEGSPRR